MHNHNRIGILLFVGIWILLIIMVIILSGCALYKCKTRVITYKDDPISYEISHIEYREWNFLERAIKIGELRRQFGRSTTIYLAWANGYGWRVLYRGTNGFIDSVTDNPSTAIPMFGFAYYNGISASGSVVYLDEKEHIVMELWHDIPRYRVRKGVGFVEIVNPSE